MIGLYIILGVLLLGIIIFRAGGKELDKRLTAFGGIKTMYAPLVDAFLSMPNAHLVDVKPSDVKVEGYYNGMNYLWSLYTKDGNKITVKFILTKQNNLVEQKVFDFPISSDWSAVEILATFHHKIEHKEILEA